MICSRENTHPFLLGFSPQDLLSPPGSIACSYSREWSKSGICLQRCSPTSQGPNLSFHFKYCWGINQLMCSLLISGTVQSRYLKYNPCFLWEVRYKPTLRALQQSLQIAFEKGMQFCVFLVSKNYIITSARKIWINQDARLGLEPCELLQGLYRGL